MEFYLLNLGRVPRAMHRDRQNPLVTIEWAE
jgi:hypothetical protein